MKNNLWHKKKHIRKDGPVKPMKNLQTFWWWDIWK